MGFSVDLFFQQRLGGGVWILFTLRLENDPAISRTNPSHKTQPVDYIYLHDPEQPQSNPNLNPKNPFQNSIFPVIFQFYSPISIHSTLSHPNPQTAKQRKIAKDFTYTNAVPALNPIPYTLHTHLYLIPSKKKISSSTNHQSNRKKQKKKILNPWLGLS